MFAMVIPMLTCVLVAIEGPTVQPRDLDVLCGKTWTGMLTYVDYRSKRRTTIRCTLEFSATDTPRKWQFGTDYPDEPGHGGKSEYLLTSDGRKLNGESIIEKRIVRKGGPMRIVTEIAGDDDGTKAILRREYTISPTQFTIRKLVKTVDARIFSERNVYEWTR